MKEFKYKSSFSSKLSCVVGKERNKYLTEASLKKLKDFLPNIDTDKNFDLLPFSANCAVVNTINLNDDGITTETALAVYRYFIHKYVNIEHERPNVIGCILMAGFSDFGTNEPLTEEQVKEYKKPFNLVIGGVIWRVVNEGVADYIEASSDPTSDHYLKVSVSWEIGFNEEEFVLIKGNSRNIEDGKIITDEIELAKFKTFSKAYGGSGKYEDSHIYRIIKGEALPLGIGVTEIPAANVKGILAQSNASLEVTEILSDLAKISLEESTKALASAITNFSTNNKVLEKEKTVNANITEISQKDEKIVNKNSIIMKITKIQDLNDENMKEVKASDVVGLFENTLKLAGEKFAEEKSAQEKAIKELDEKNKVYASQAEQAKKDLEKLTEDLKTIKAEVEKRQKEDAFNVRMAQLDESFNLDKEHREIIASEIKDLDEKGFEAYAKKLEVFMKDKKKVAAKDKLEDVIDDVVTAGKKTKTAIANSTDLSPKGYEKYKDSFALDKISS